MSLLKNCFSLDETVLSVTLPARHATQAICCMNSEVIRAISLLVTLNMPLPAEAAGWIRASLPILRGNFGMWKLESLADSSSTHFCHQSSASSRGMPIDAHCVKTKDDFVRYQRSIVHRNLQQTNCSTNLALILNFCSSQRAKKLGTSRNQKHSQLQLIWRRMLL